MIYATLDEWLNEIEGFATRGERLHDEFGPQTQQVLFWIRTAWQLGEEAEREACAQIGDDGFRYSSDPSAAEMARTIAALIRARTTAETEEKT